MLFRSKCHPNDFEEKNAASDRGIDMVRMVQSRMSLASLGGGCRIFYFDECHQATSQAQDCLLKMLEDTPKHVYFFLATTDPGKLKTTIKTRCTEIRVQPLSDKNMTTLLVNVLEKEGISVTGEVLERIVEAADGSPRKALVLLNQVYKMGDEEDQLNAVVNSDSKAQAIEIARLLLRKAPWPQLAKVLKEVQDEPEQLRYMILGYMTTVLLGGGKLSGRAWLIIQIMRDNLYDSKKAGLVANCWEAITSK